MQTQDLTQILARLQWYYFANAPPLASPAYDGPVVAPAVTAQLPIAQTVPVLVAEMATPIPSRLLDANTQPAVSGSHVRRCDAFDDELS